MSAPGGYARAARARRAAAHKASGSVMRLSTVDSVETSTGRLALVLELAGANSGHYGVHDTATSGVLPPVAPLPAGG